MNFAIKVSSLLILIMMLLFAPTYGQRGPGERTGFQLTASGQIKDGQTKSALEYATVSIFSKKDSSLIGGGMTEGDGSFSFSFKPGPIYLLVEYLGYESMTIDNIEIDREKIKSDRGKLDLGVIELYEGGIEMDEVEIRADKSETQFSLDKQIFNVGKDLANRGGTAEDILDNVPSVTVDIEGNVSLRGRQGVRILVDGKPSTLTSGSLNAIAANTIDRIEVITNPSARYEAEGMAGIINIVMKKNEGHGFNGAFSASAGWPGRYGGSANLNYRKGDINWFLNYGYNYRTSPSFGYNFQRRDLGENTFSILDQDNEREAIGDNHNIRFGLDYFFSEKDKLTAAAMYRVGLQDNIATNTYRDYILTNDVAGPEDVSTRIDNEVEDRLNQEYSLNYTKEFSSRQHKLDATVQYTERSETEISDINQAFQYATVPSPDALLQHSFNDAGYNTWLAQIDYVHPYRKEHKWEVGVRSSLRDVANNYFAGDVIGTDTIAIPGLVNDFFYNEDIHAGYFIYGNTLDPFSYQVGLRGEYSLIDTELKDAENGVSSRHYFNLFPSAHLNFKSSEANSWQISYSRRINRPRFWDLNPFFAYTDNRNIRSGNPLVDPEYTDSYELSNIRIWEKFNFTGAIFYRKTTQSKQWIKIISANNNTTLFTPLNGGEYNDIGLDFNASYRGIDWLRLDLNFSAFHNALTLEEEELNVAVYNYYKDVQFFEGSEEQFQDEFFFNFNNTNRISYNGRMTLRFTFWESDLQFRGNYRSARAAAQGSWKPMGSLDIGWSKDFLSKNLTLTLSARDIFNTRRRGATTEFENYYEESSFQWRSRYADLTASYRINQKKKRGRPGGGGGYGV